MVIGEVTVTLVEAVLPLPSVDVAVTWHVPGTSGAVNSPPLEVMEPHRAVNVAETLVVNCWVAFSVTVGVSGDKVNCSGAPMVSLAVALSTGPLVAVAVMVHTVPDGDDAVNRPAEEMLPQLADQLTG